MHTLQRDCLPGCTKQGFIFRVLVVLSFDVYETVNGANHGPI